MFEIQTASHKPDNFFAGKFPIVTDVMTVKAGVTVRARTPVVLGADGVEEAAAATVADVVAITAAEPSGDEVVVYLTGEFFSQALALPDGVTVEALKPVLRNKSIFLKEVNINV